MSTTTQIIVPADQAMESSAPQSSLDGVFAGRFGSMEAHLTSLDSMLAIVSDDDDDDSICERKRRSSSDECSSSKKRRRSQRERTTNKMLRFAVDPEVITTNTVPTECPSNASWYSRNELMTMKANCRRLATSASASLKNEVFSLHNSDIATPSVAFSEEFQLRRGLERWSSALNYQARAIDVLQSKSAVFMEQTTQQIQQLKSSPQSVHILAAAYRESTFKAKLFARALAKADEQAVSK